MSTLRIAVTADIDNDWCQDPNEDGPGDLRWRGLEEGVPRLLDELGGVTDSSGTDILWTWFVRADDQLAHHYGSVTHLLESNDALWSRLQRAGHEVAWHPHLYRMDSGRWVLETDDGALEEQVDRAWGSICSLRYRFRSVRIGECFHSDRLMASLAGLGLRADATALPGRRRSDESKTLDWLPTPELPYRPSVADYRIPGTPAHSIWEVPFTMVTTRAPYDHEPLRRYLNLGYRAAALRDGLRAVLATSPLLVAIVHPYELLPRRANESSHPLFDHSPRTARENLETILEECRRIGRDVRFVTISGIADRCDALAAGDG